MEKASQFKFRKDLKPTLPKKLGLKKKVINLGVNRRAETDFKKKKKFLDFSKKKLE